MTSRATRPRETPTAIFQPLPEEVEEEEGLGEEGNKTVKVGS